MSQAIHPRSGARTARRGTRRGGTNVPLQVPRAAAAGSAPTGGAGSHLIGLPQSTAFVYYSRNTGQEHWYVTWGPFLMAGGAALLGVPVYVSQRQRMSEPQAVGEYR